MEGRRLISGGRGDVWGIGWDDAHMWLVPGTLSSIQASPLQAMELAMQGAHCWGSWGGQGWGGVTWMERSGSPALIPSRGALRGPLIPLAPQWLPLATPRPGESNPRLGKGEWSLRPEAGGL